MLKATVAGHSFEVDADANTVDGKVLQWDVSALSQNHFHILLDGKRFKAELVKRDPATKTVVIKCNGHTYTVDLKDSFDQLLENMGMSGKAAARVNNLRAPMPGLIIDLKVNAGDAVAAGDPLLVLEAMKMENVIKAAGDAVVKSVKVKRGDSVEKGQVLIEF